MQPAQRNFAGSTRSRAFTTSILPSGERIRRTFRISDPAPVTPGLQLRRNRGVRCIRFVRPCRSHSQKPLTTMAEESRQRNPRLNAERSFLCQTFRCRHRLGRHEPSVRRLNSPKSPASKTESPKTARCKSAQRTQSSGAKWSNVRAHRPPSPDSGNFQNSKAPVPSANGGSVQRSGSAPQSSSLKNLLSLALGKHRRTSAPRFAGIRTVGMYPQNTKHPERICVHPRASAVKESFYQLTVCSPPNVRGERRR